MGVFTHRDRAASFLRSNVCVQVFLTQNIFQHVSSHSIFNGVWAEARVADVSFNALT